MHRIYYYTSRCSETFYIYMNLTSQRLNRFIIYSALYMHMSSKRKTRSPQLAELTRKKTTPYYRDIRAHFRDWHYCLAHANYMDIRPALVSSIVQSCSLQRRSPAAPVGKLQSRAQRTIRTGDRVPKKFRRLESAPRQIRPAAALSYLPRARMLCPRVITFRGSLTLDNYSAVLVNFPWNKRTTTTTTTSAMTPSSCKRERRYQSCDFYGTYKDQSLLAWSSVWRNRSLEQEGSPVWWLATTTPSISARGWLFSGRPSRVEVSERHGITCFYRGTVHPLLSQI